MICGLYLPGLPPPHKGIPLFFHRPAASYSCGLWLNLSARLYPRGSSYRHCDSTVPCRRHNEPTPNLPACYGLCDHTSGFIFLGSTSRRLQDIRKCFVIVISEVILGIVFDPYIMVKGFTRCDVQIIRNLVIRGEKDNPGT